MAITFVLASAVVSDGLATGSAASTVTPALPTGTASGDRVFVGTVGTTAAGTTPTGWTLVGTATLGTGTVAASAGTRVVTVYFRDYDGAWTMPAFTQASGATPTLTGAAVTYRKAAGEAWGTPTFTTGSDTATTGTGYSATGAANLSVTAGDLLLGFQGNPSNVTTTAGAMTATGLTMGTVNERADGGSATGFDASIHVFEALPTAGTSTAAPVQTSTVSTTAQSSGGTMFVRQAVYVPQPDIAGFTDDFATTDTGKWTFASNATTSGGRLSIDCTTAYTGVYSVGSWSLIGSSASVEVVQTPVLGVGTTSIIYFLGDASANDVRFVWEGGNLSSRRKIAGTETAINTVAFSATSHRFLRISESGGVVTWATSPDASTWTTFGATWTAAGVDLSSVNVAINSGYWGAETAPGTALLDNFNLAPPTSTPYTASPADPAAATDAVSLSTSRTLADAAAAADAVSVIQGSARTAADVGAGVDTASVVQGQVQTYADTAAGSDAVSFVRAVQVSVADAAGAIDAASATLVVQSAAADTAAAVDAVAFVQTVARTSSDAAAVVDAAGRTVDAQRAPADSAGGSDSVTPMLTTPATFYVAGTGGSDAGDGRSTGTAWATVAKVNATTFNPGDTVLFQRGATFTGTGLVANNSGTSAQRITFGAYGTGALPILDGGGGTGTGTPVLVTGAYVTIQDLQAQNAGTGLSGDLGQRGISYSGTDGLVQRCVVTANAIGIQVNTGAHRLRVTGCDLSNNTTIIAPAGADNDYGAIGISLQQADYCEIDHNTINNCYGASPDYGTDGSAIEMFGSIGSVVHHNTASNNQTFTELGDPRTSDITYHNNLISGTPAGPATQLAFTLQGSANWGPVTNIKIHHNTVFMTNTGSQGLVVAAGATVSVHNNIIRAAYLGWTDTTKIDEGHNVYFGAASAPDIWSTANAGQGIASTSVVADPLFVSTSAPDLHIKTGSPAINRGVDLGYTTDYDGNPRISNGFPDAGAFELQASASPADVAGVSDLVTTAAAAARTAADVAAGADAVSALVGASRSAADLAAAVDTADATQGAARTVADTAAAVDAVTTSSASFVTVTDSAGVVDSAPSYAVDRSAADAAGAVDAVTVTQAIQSTASDAAAASDAVTVSLSGALSATAADAAAVVDAVSTTTSSSVTVTDSAAAVDAATISRSSAAADVAGAVDAASAVQASQATVADTADAVDAVSVNAAGSRSATATDAADALDAVGTAVASARSVADVAGAVDAVATATGAQTTAADTAGAVDAVSISLSGGLTPADAAAAVDAVSWIASATVTFADAIATVDTITPVQSLARGAADTAGAVDTANAGLTLLLQGSAADTAGATDVVTASVSRESSPADTASASDAVTYTMVRVVFVDDTAGVADAVAPQRNSSWLVADSAAAVDAAQGVLANAGLMTVRWRLRYGDVGGRLRIGTLMGRLLGD